MKDIGDVSRRRFLQTAGAGLAGVALSETLAATAAEGPGEREDQSAADLQAGSVAARPGGRVGRVNLLQGTHSTKAFSRGNTLPIAAMPFGMQHWTLQSSAAGEPWFFRPEDERLEGIRCTHQLSPWLSDYGHAAFMPFTGDPPPAPAKRASSYRQNEAILAPCYLRLDLLRYRCTIELVPTERGAILRMKFHEPGSVGLMVDLPGEDADFAEVQEGKILAGSTRANRGGVPEGFAAHYVLQADTPIVSSSVQKIEGRRVAVLRFKPAKDAAVECRIAGSFLSREQAFITLRRELGTQSFEDLRAAAEQAWEKELARIDVEGGSDEQQRVFLFLHVSRSVVSSHLSRI